MQTTLLGFAIVIILALLAALVGPLLIDWNRYRAEFESHARQLTGLDLHIAGSVDARLLPTPTVVMHGIEFGRSDEIGRVRAKALRIEFALGALVRGEWRITEARLDGPELAAGLDSSGRLNLPVPKVAFNPETVSIERLNIRDGRAVLADAASGSRLVLDQLEFRGELRSLAGPVKGEGSFVAAGAHYPYRFSTSRTADNSGMRLRLLVDPIDRPLNAEVDISVWLDGSAPRFDGTIALGARPGARAPHGAQAPVEFWRIGSKVKGDSKAAVLEQIEFQYGPDERPTKLKGNAQVRFGRQPLLTGVLSSTQIDLDRVLALPDPAMGRPFAVVKSLAEGLGAQLRTPIPLNLSISVESVTLSGAVLQRVGAELELDSERLDIKTLEFRAPGLTQVRLSGRLGPLSSRVQFDGSTRIEANDPRALVAWLSGRSDGQAMASGPLRVGGDLVLSGTAIAIERLKLDLDRMAVAGRFAYSWGSEDRPARIDADLSTPEIDLDRVHALAKALLGDTAMDWPREGALAIKIGRATALGVEAKQVDVNVRIDAGGIEIDKLSLGEFGGAALAVKGRIDTKTESPRGAVTLDLNARTLDGVVAVVEKVAPDIAEQLRRTATRIAPVSLRASLTADPGSSGNALANAKFKIEGRAGPSFRVALLGDASTAGDAFKADRIGALGAAKVNLSGHIEADDSAALVELVGLDRFISAEKKPGRLSVAAKGPLDGELEVKGQLAAGSLDIATDGRLRASPRTNPSATLDLKLSNANIRSPRPVVAGRPAEFLPATLNTRLALADGTWRLTDIKGVVAGAQVGGRLTVSMQQPIAIDGDMELGTFDLPAAVATAIGIPARGAATSAGALWPSEPFEQMLGPFSGQLVLKSARVTLTPKLEARNFQGKVRFGETYIALEASEANIAGGRLAGESVFLRNHEGLIARTRVKVIGANASELLPGAGTVSGRLRLDITAEGSGMSPVALMGSLAGNGTFTLENARVARLDPGAFNTVMRAVDQGLPVDQNRIRDRMDFALAGGGLAVPIAEGAITVEAGHARLTNSMSGAQNTELAVNGTVHLIEGAVDARLSFSAPLGAGGPANTRPEIEIMLKGPLDMPRRSIDVAPFASWLALRAVEQQSKKLDVLEGREPSQPPNVDQAPAESVIQRTPVPPAPRGQNGSDALQQRSILRNRPNGSTAKPAPGDAVQPLPPPIDIRPAPGSRPSRAQPGVVGQQNKPPPPTVTRPRSLSEILFGH